MATLPDRKTLASMRRADLQKLCKDRGLKANLKSEELIDLLLETSKPTEPSRSAPRSSSMRIVSRAGSGSTTKGRVGSMIVHEGDDESEDPKDRSRSSVQPGVSAEPQQDLTGPSTRRKAKETQYRLGVGRPSAIGGTGARTVTASVSKPKGKRAKGNASVRPTEDVIQEEEEEELPLAETDGLAEIPQAGPSRTSHEPVVQGPAPPVPLSLDNSEKFKTYVSGIVEPIQARLRALDERLQSATDAETLNIDALRSSVAALSSQIAEIQAQGAERDRVFESMKDELAAIRLARSEPTNHGRAESGTTGGRSGPTESRDLGTTVASSSLTVSPPKSSLGKHHRDPDETGVHLGSIKTIGRVLRPQRKKAKLDSADDMAALSHEPDTIADEEDDNADAEEEVNQPRQRTSGFTIFSGPEEPPERGAFSDGPPPTTRLSDLFAFPATTPPNAATPSVPTSTANGAENQAPATGNAFSFSFVNSIFRPMTSTPAALRIPSIPQPEPPTSPTPAGPSGGYIERSGGRRERNDLFHPYGLPRPGSRPSSRAAQPQAQPGPATAGPSREPSRDSSVNPVALMQTPLPSVPEETQSTPGSQGKMYTNPMRVGNLGIGLPGIVPLPMPPDTPGQPMKRTMYGTELERDTRFGDFGVEGVAMGFWTGAAPRC